MKRATAKAPAKLILSGEHSVVYGAPAIAVAVDRYAKTTVVQREDLGIHIHLPNLDYTKLMTVKTLRGLKRRLKDKYKQFTRGDSPVRDILQTPFELAQFVMINTADYLKTTLGDVSISTQSSIPVGCGLGSSAATSLSVIYAVAKFMNTDMRIDEYFELGQAAEQLQHGYPSGLDVQTILQGGCLLWENNQCTSQAVHLDKLNIVNTGQPSVKTGECVQSVKEKFSDSNIWQSFRAVTQRVGSALYDNQPAALASAITDNQYLLYEIGVVPKRVQTFIDSLQANGMSAKICGAGCTQGDAAGMVWVTDENDALQGLVDKFGYTQQTLHIETRGVLHVES